MMLAGEPQQPQQLLLVFVMAMTAASHITKSSTTCQTCCYRSHHQTNLTN